MFQLFSVSASFHNAKIDHTNFEQTTCVSCRFYYTFISHSQFWNSNLKRAIFKNASLEYNDFSHANMYQVDFTGANINETDLKNALFFQDVLLPNGTHVHDKNLINNGQVDCNISLHKSWTLEAGNIVIMMLNETSHRCCFVLQSLTAGARMSQNVELLNRWNSSLWPYSEAILSAQMSVGVSMKLKGITDDGSIFSDRILSKFLDDIRQNVIIIYHF